MEFALWAYPWDLVDGGVVDTAERLTADGIDELNVATNYHSVQAFTPHNPTRSTFFAHASSYFHPSDDYGRLSPIPNETMGDDDWLSEIAEGLASTPISLNSWTIGCHNSRLGMASPDVTLENPYGDRLIFGLCPSHPDVRAYLTALLRDLNERASFNRIELETFDYFYGTGFGWHHDKFHVDLGDVGEYLFGLCFCEHCQANAEEAGVDTAAARETCVEILELLVDGRLDPDLALADWLLGQPHLREYIEVRGRTLTDLYAEFDEATGDSDLGYYLGMVGGPEESWKVGVDINGIEDALDYVTVIAYESSPEAVLDRVAVARTLTDVPIHVGLLPGHPVIDDQEAVAAIVDGLADADVERVSFYNYGLLPERNLEWIRRAVEPHREE